MKNEKLRMRKGIQNTADGPWLKAGSEYSRKAKATRQQGIKETSKTQKLKAEPETRKLKLES